MLLYADEIVLFANNAEELQLGLNFLSEYCTRWKLKVNASETKVLILRKDGTLQINLIFLYEDQPIEIVSSSNTWALYLPQAVLSQKHKLRWQGKHKRLYLN